MDSKDFKDSVLSYSSIKAFAKSPNHFIDYKTREQPDKAHFAFGRAFHGFILEPEKFDSEYQVVPKVDRRTKAGKQEYLELMEAAGDRDIIQGPEFHCIKEMAKSVAEYAPAMDLLDGTLRETHIKGDIGGVPFHGYADAHDSNRNYAIDLKTCRDASKDAFMRDAHNMDYHLQAAIYKKLLNVERFYWVVVEKESPYNVAVFMQSEDAAKKSDHYLNTLTEKWKAWNGSPQTYSKEIQVLDLPRWA